MYLKDKKDSNSGFAIIEILIWIFIFTLWLISVYLLITSSLRLNLISKNQIIASNLSKEWIELIRNIRDSNYINHHKWNQLNPSENLDYSKVFMQWKIYTIENNFSNIWPLVRINDITSIFWEWSSEINLKMQNYRLCLDLNNRYTHDCITLWHKKTHFYRFLKIEEVKDIDWIISDSLQIISKVIWTEKWYHNVEIKTILTDWKRL